MAHDDHRARPRISGRLNANVWADSRICLGRGQERLPASGHLVTRRARRWSRDIFAHPVAYRDLGDSRPTARPARSKANLYPSTSSPSRAVIRRHRVQRCDLGTPAVSVRMVSVSCGCRPRARFTLRPRWHGTQRVQEIPIRQWGY
jgi:hypothetical protein